MTSALTKPFASFVVPAKASRKLAPGSAMEVLPPRTTRPVMLMLHGVNKTFLCEEHDATYKTSVLTLTNPMTSEKSMESLLLVTPTVFFSSVYGLHSRGRNELTDNSCRIASNRNTFRFPFGWRTPSHAEDVCRED